MSPTNARKYPLAQQLLVASAKGRLHEVIKLLQEGATLAVNKHGRTPLHISAHRGYLDIVRTLLQAGCNPDIQDDNGDTALHRAVTSGHERIVQRLLDESCGIDRQNNLGDTALHEASRCGHSRIVKCLIKANANVQCGNKNGNVPLHMSCANGHATSTQQLLSASSSPSYCNNQKDTPLHLTVRYGHCTCARLLLGSNCNVNFQNQFGNTALHIATMTQKRKLVRILLDGDAEPQRLRNCDNKSPVDLAKDLENGELVLMLISGARPHGWMSRRKSSSMKCRSHFNPRVDTRSKSSSEECHAGPSLRRLPSRIKKKRNYQSIPELHKYNLKNREHRKISQSVKHVAPHSETMTDHQRNLTINPYVVPQLYYLYRDSNGDVQQSPIIDQLPNPTPQIVTQLNNSIEQAKQEFVHSIDEARTSLTKRIEELENKTEYRLKSLDHITSDRINVERIMCLHRIDQRATYERKISEKSVMEMLHSWMETRIDQKQSNWMNRPYSYDVAPDLFSSSKEIAQKSEQSIASRQTTGRKSKSAFNKVLLCSNATTESEVRSLDSGVGGPAGMKVSEPFIFKDESPLHSHGVRDYHNTSWMDGPCGSGSVLHNGVPPANLHESPNDNNSMNALYTNNSMLYPPLNPCTSSYPFKLHSAAGTHESKEPTSYADSTGNFFCRANAEIAGDKVFHPHQERLWHNVPYNNKAELHSDWDDLVDEDIAIIEQLQNITLAHSHAV